MVELTLAECGRYTDPAPSQAFCLARQIMDAHIAPKRAIHCDELNGAREAELASIAFAEVDGAR